MNDDELRQELQSRIPAAAVGYWDSIDQRLGEVEQAQEFEPAMDTDAAVVRLTDMNASDDGPDTHVGHRGHYLMAAAVLVVVLALGAVVFANRSSTTTAGELDLVTQPETSGDSDGDGAPEDIGDPTAAAERPAGWVATDSVDEPRLPASKHCYGDDVTVMVLSFREDAETFVGGIRTTIDGLVNHVGVSGVRFDGTLFQVQSRRVGGVGTDSQEWGAFRDGISTPYGLLAPIPCEDRSAEVEKIDAAVTRYPAFSQD